LNLSKLVQKLKYHRPTTAKAFEELLGRDLIRIDSGCFREVFAIQGTRLVVKIPFTERNEHHYSLVHARREIRRVKQVLRNKKYRALWRYVPKIYYSDYATGIVVMTLLNKVGKVSKEAEKTVDNLMEDTFSCIGHQADAEYTNLGYDGRGQIKILDWGCI